MAFLEASYYYVFSGTNYLELPTTISLTGDFTIETWVYPTANDANYSVFVGGTVSSSPQFWYKSDGSVGCYILGDYPINAAGTGVTLNNWHHIAFVRSGSTIKAYVNGIDVGTGTGTGTSTQAANVKRIGSFNGSYSVYGRLSNLRITNNAIYTSNFTPSREQLTKTNNTQLLTCLSPYVGDNGPNNYAFTNVGGVYADNTSSQISGTAITNYFVPISDYSHYLPLGGAMASGKNGDYQLGIGSGQYSSPVQVGTALNWNDVSLLRSNQGSAFLSEESKLYTAGSTSSRAYPSSIKSTEIWKEGSGGYTHTMMINTNGSLWTWGNNDYGKLGLSDATNRSSPTQVGTLSNWSKVACGFQHTIAIKTDGTLWSWGWNNSGALGISAGITQIYSPIQVGTESNWSKISNGYQFNHAIKTDGTLWAWGYNNLGQLGISNNADRLSPVQIGALSNWSQVENGYQHTLAIKTDGTLWSWGRNVNFQLGLNTTTAAVYSPVQIGALSNWSQVACGYYFSAAVKTDGTLWTWGGNAQGQLGQSNVTNRSSPTQVGTLSNWSKVACGYAHTMAIKTDGTLWTWGWGTQAQLGTGQSTAYSPVQVGVLSDWNRLLSNKSNSVSHYLKTNNTLWLNGAPVPLNGDQGYFGSFFPTKKSEILLKNLATSDYDAFAIDKIENTIYQTTDNDIPTINTSITWTSIGTGKNHFVGIKTDGTAWSIGNNDYGQLGVSDTTYRRSLVQIGTASNWSKVYCSDYGTMLVDNSMNGYAFGENDTGQLGIGDNTNRSSPVQIAFGDVDSFAAGFEHLMFTKIDGTLWATGSATNSQLGLSNVTNRSSPVQVGTSNDWNKISAGGEGHTIAIKTNGTLWAWGYNAFGQLGNNSNSSPVYTPVQIGSDTTWSQISAGENHTSAIKTDGTLWTWGYNLYGQLGLSDTTNRSSPTQVGTLSNWNKISSGSTNTIGIKTDGTLWSWGRNVFGILGLSDTTDRYSPVQVGTLSNWSQVAAGHFNTAAVKTDGTLWTWGHNDAGPLGLGDLTDRSSPVQVGSLSNWSQVACGRDGTFALKTNGTLWAWGYGAYGQLGQSNQTGYSSPVQVGTLSDWVSISSGYFFNTAKRSNGSLWVMGYNNRGQLGLSDTNTRYSPIQLGSSQVFAASMDDNNLWIVDRDKSLWSSGRNNNILWGATTTTFIGTSIFAQVTGRWSKIDKGGNHTIGVRTDGTMWACGNNSEGQLGLNTQTHVSSFTQVGGLSNWSKVRAFSDSSWAIKTDGTLWAWGYNGGALGLSISGLRALSPMQIGTSSNWSSVENGLALKTDGTIWTWGSNGYGQLGLNTSSAITVSTPVQLGSSSDWSFISAGESHKLAIKNNGTLYAWGRNDWGQLGLTDQTNRSSPTQVGTLSDWSKVSSVNFSGAFAIKTDGTLWAWGFTSQVVPGPTFVYSPVQVGSSKDWTNVSVGGVVYATKTDGSLWTWGNNQFGQLGDNAITSRSYPVQITRLPKSYGWSELTVGSRSGAVLNNDGSLWSAGSNTYGQIGDLAEVPFLTKKSTYGDTYNTVATGNNSTLFTKTDGTIWAVGVNSYGQLGLNQAGSYTTSSPVQVGLINTGTKVETKNFSSIFLFK